MKKKTRKQAIQDKDKYYYTGIKCKHGHLSKRETLTGACIECRQQYQRDRYQETKKALGI